MKRFVVFAALAAAALAVAVPAFAYNESPGKKTTSMTTLDACGYFVGWQTANKTTESETSFAEKGTWTGVGNNYYLTPVASLGTVTGSYSDSYDFDSATGAVSNGSEIFRSDAGMITQSFSFDPISGWHVSVTATGDLSFLTSNTDGGCYTGAFPRS
jgi:hypothetical protein